MLDFEMLLCLSFFLDLFDFIDVHPRERDIEPLQFASIETDTSIALFSSL